MRSAALSIMACLMLATVGTAGARTDGKAPASLHGLACQQSANPLNRVISVSATMKPMAGTERMALRFELLEQLPGGSFHRLRGGDLGRWDHPNPPTFGQQPGDTWVVNKPVANLDAPAVYRFRVTFRWVGAGGVIATATRLSALCAESE